MSLCHHGAILAGSGAGKSTVVGRIVEELLLKTRARVVVLDTNGDFRNAHIITDGDHIWKEEGSFGGIFSSRENFRRRWREVKKTYFTYDSNHQQTIATKWIKPALSWSRLPVQWQMDILGLELSRNPNEVAALYRVTERLGDEGEMNAPISPGTVEMELESMITTSAILSSPVDKRTDTALQMRFRQASELDIWRKKADDADLCSSPLNPPIGEATHPDQPRLSVFDVPSISNATSRNILVAFMLKLLWEGAQDHWEHAVDDPENDNRPPTFLVVDEAHNFVPAEDPADAHALRISQTIQRIAAEGRKYGLFLLIATQRPSKIRPGLLSECENVCLLRLRSPIERRLAVDTWALRAQHKKERAPLAKLGRGEGLLCGYWANWAEIPFKGGLRRTQATGGDLSEDWIGHQKLPC